MRKKVIKRKFIISYLKSSWNDDFLIPYLYHEGRCLGDLLVTTAFHWGIHVSGEYKAVLKIHPKGRCSLEKSHFGYHIINSKGEDWGFICEKGFDPLFGVSCIDEKFDLEVSFDSRKQKGYKKWNR